MAIREAIACTQVAIKSAPGAASNAAIIIYATATSAEPIENYKCRMIDLQRAYPDLRRVRRYL